MCCRHSLFGRRRLSEIGFELFLQAADAGFDFTAHIVGKLVEHLGLHHLAAVHGRHAEAQRRLHDGDILRRGSLVQRLDYVTLAGVILLVDGGASGADIPRCRTRPAASR